MRALTVISGVVMAAAGVFCVVNMGHTFLAVAFVVGMVMVFSGIVHSLAYLMGRGFHNKGDNNGWILIDGLLTLLLGILVLCNQLVADAAVPMVFGLWILISGLLRIEAASHINRDKKMRNFRSTFVTGIVTALVGIVGFINPLVQWVTTVVLLGVFMIVQGVNIVELGVNMPHEKKEYVKIYKKNRDIVRIDDRVDETPEKIAERFKKQQEGSGLGRKMGAAGDEKKV